MSRRRASYVPYEPLPENVVYLGHYGERRRAPRFTAADLLGPLMWVVVNFASLLILLAALAFAMRWG